MKAMVLRGKDLIVEEVEKPSPGPGQVLAKVRACGICGSDLHAARFMDDMIAASKASGRTAWDTIDPAKGMVMGHEFVAEIVEAGPGVDDWQPGTRVTCIPVLPDPAAQNGFYSIGYSPEKPGGYGEYVVLSAALLLLVEDNVSDTVAATIEPCAVGLHAVREAHLKGGETALVMGAGPIGLMTLSVAEAGRMREGRGFRPLARPEGAGGEAWGGRGYRPDGAAGNRDPFGGRWRPSS